MSKHIKLGVLALSFFAAVCGGSYLLGGMEAVRFALGATLIVLAIPLILGTIHFYCELY